MKRKFYLILFFAAFIINTNAQHQQIKVGTSTRTMFVYAPEDLPENRPLLISMHGMNQDPNYQKGQANYEAIADTAKFVVVYPQGEGNAWDISGTKDIDFIVAIIDEMHTKYNIDRDRVYLSGFSMGGMMTYYAATKIADKIAAFAPVAGYLMSGPNAVSSRPIPLIHIHGTNDDVCVFGPVQTHLDAWIKRNSCWTRGATTQPYPKGKITSNATHKVWKEGENGVEVVLISLQGVGHWHSNNPSGIYSNEEIWNFCKRYSVHGLIDNPLSVDAPESTPDATIISREYYNLQGNKVDITNTTTNEIYISRNLLSDGSVKAAKEYIRK